MILVVSDDFSAPPEAWRELSQAIEREIARQVEARHRRLRTWLSRRGGRVNQPPPPPERAILLGPDRGTAGLPCAAHDERGLGAGARYGRPRGSPTAGGDR